MNHDAAHCMDFDKNKCPNECYRAQLTREVEDHRELWGIPLAYSYFKGTTECPMEVSEWE